MKRFKPVRIKIWRFMWHDWFGHPIEAIATGLDLRPEGSLWGECESCGAALQLKPPTHRGEPYFPIADQHRQDEAKTDEYRYGVDRSDA